MRSALLLALVPLLSACVREAEGIVRERAATEFACAHYALQVEEVGPDVYRASGCGQELIYACRPAERPGAERAPGEEDDFADKAPEPRMVCARRLR